MKYTAPSAFLALLLTAGCLHASPKPVTSATIAPPWEAGYDIAVLVVHLPGAIATGAVVDVRGYVLTNQHVTQIRLGPKGWTSGLYYVCDVRTGVPKCASAELVAEDREDDLALLKVDYRFPRAVVWGDENALKPEADLHILGHITDYAPLTALHGRFMNLLAEPYFAQSRYPLKLPMMLIDAVVVQAMSGGPVFNDAGEGVGLTDALTNGGSNGGRPFGVAIPATTIKAFLKKHLPPA